MSFFRWVCSLAVLTSLAAGQSADRVEDLRSRAKAASEKIAEIVRQGPDASDQSMETLQKLVEELRTIRTELQAISGIREPAKKIALGGYIQTQYQSSDRNIGPTGPFDAYRIRRGRITLDADPKERLHVRFSFDTTAGTNQSSFNMREAWARYTTPGSMPLSLTFGQQPFPLGFETERSSFDIEFPERTLASNTLFGGEFFPGFKASKDLAPGVNAQVGLMQALSSGDPEQSDRNPGSGDELGVVGALTYSQGGNRLRLSGFVAERPKYTVASSGAVLPSANRELVALDGALQTRLIKPLTLRGEVIAGRDRLPLTAEEAPLVAWYAMARFDLDSHNQIALRYQQMDRNRDERGDGLVAYGLAYIWQFDRDLKLSLSHEVFVDSLRRRLAQQRYGETVLRLSVRF